MDDPKRKRTRRLIYLIAAAVCVGIVIFLLRGTYISNALKKIIQPELEMATGRKVIAQQIYLNLFPLFVEAKDIKVFDEAGERILAVKRTKAYIDVSGLLRRQIVIRRLVIKEPDITTDRKQAEEIIESAKAYLSKVRDTALKVKVLVVEVQNGSLKLDDEENLAASDLKGFAGEAILGEAPRVRASVKRVLVRKEGLPEIEGDVSVDLLFRDGAVLVKRLAVGSFGSKLTGSGQALEKKGEFTVDLKMLFTTLRKIFHLERSGEGNITASGTVKYLDRDVTLDLKVNGKFYLQTLMELLSVKEKIEGFAEAKGEIKGPLKNVKGSGTLSLRKGNLFDVDIESMKCRVSYENGRMDFTDGSGRIYNGTAGVTASIALPVVNSFSVDVDFRDVDSPAVFKLIGWDPGIEPGKVTGKLRSSGQEFNPEGHFEYRSTKEGKDVLGRIRSISGKFNMQGPVITLADTKLNTGRSDIYVRGTADTGKKALDLEVLLKSKDMLDLTAPYYEKLKGSGEFSGSVTGVFSDPVITGVLRMYNPLFEGYKAAIMRADFSYRKDMCNIRDMSAEGDGAAMRVKGSIIFKKAKGLFDLAEPEYRLNASLKNTDLEKFAKIFYPDFVGTGKLQAGVKIRGRADNPELSGDGLVENAVIYMLPFDQASFGWSYSGKKLNFERMRIVRGKSVVHADAGLDAEGNFSYHASSDRILLSDSVGREINGEAVFTVRSEGKGTFANPSLSLTARIVEGRLRGKSVGGGLVSVSVKDKNISLKADILENRVRIVGKGRLEKEIPWDAEIDIQTGRYDNVISAFLKDVPEDLLLSLNGKVVLHGDKKHVSASSTINQLTLSMYGYSFTNEKEIKFDLKDKQIVLESVLLRSGNTSVRVEGGLELGRQYNLVMEGSSSLSPLKSLSSKIAVLRGDAEFVLSVIGGWETPAINGGVTLTNGAFGLKDYPYRISSLNGYLYMDNDRIVLQKLAGKIGGGDIDLSGIVYLRKFAVKRYYVETVLNNVTASFASDVNVNFGGNILFKGVPESQLISGDIKINRARYRERIDWKSWLLKTKKVEKYKGELSGLEKAELNIRITGKDNIHIDNNVARADVAADLIVRGTVYRPTLLGRSELTNGTLYFRNNEFRILHASVDFTDPNRINPFVNISADTVVKNYRIKMNLEGQIDHFNMSLSSDPVLKEGDILSLLTVGQTGGELKGMEGGIGASEATSFVTGKLQDVVEERVRTITGLDRMQIDPHVSKITGTVEPRVTVSKRLLGDKVFVTYTSSLGSAEEQIVKLEYFLSRSISLVGVRDERGIVGGDIRFRFEFK